MIFGRIDVPDWRTVHPSSPLQTGVQSATPLPASESSPQVEQRSDVRLNQQYPRGTDCSEAPSQTPDGNGADHLRHGVTGQFQAALGRVERNGQRDVAALARDGRRVERVAINDWVVMERGRVIAELADVIAAIRCGHPVRVGIDGVDCAGKTMLADELVEPLRARGRRVIRASIDKFHNPRHVRYRQGRSSPNGYYEDSFGTAAVLSCLLLPLGPDGDRRYKTAQFDFRTDSPVTCAWRVTTQDAVLIFEGVFLHRPELRPHWDFTVFVDTAFDVAVQRACTRDSYLFQSQEQTRHMYNKRYVPGQKLYLAEQAPIKKANAVLKNDDIQNPELVVNRAWGCP